MPAFDSYIGLLAHEALERREAHDDCSEWWTLHNPLDCTHCQAHVARLTRTLGSTHHCTCQTCGNTHIHREIPAQC